MLELGLPLDHGRDWPGALPAVRGLSPGSDPDGLMAIIISHAHPDHAGLLPAATCRVRVFGGGAAHRIARAAAPFIAGTTAPRDWLPIHDRQKLAVGPFSVTPLLVDHSAFDAYALLVEAAGRRLLYSGDLRSHGRKPSTWQRLVNKPPAGVHALLLEGTRLGRPRELNTTEQDVERQVAEVCGRTYGMVLACYSGQHIDRLVTVYRAARRAGRILVLDLYGATVAAATGRDTIPQSSWKNVRVFVPSAQRRRIIETKRFDLIEAIRPHRIFPEQLAGLGERAVLAMRGSMTRELERARCLAGAAAVWSMWPGYLDEAPGRRLREWLADHEIPLTTIHASGHATVPDLQALAAAVDAQQVVPIHTAAPQRYVDLFANVKIHEDGSWWPV